MNKLFKFITVIFIVLLIPVSNAASKKELEGLYSMQAPGTVIQCKKTDETVFIKIRSILLYTVTEKSENKTNMHARVVIYVSGFKEFRFEAEFKTTRTMLEARDLWEADPDSLVVKVSGKDAELFKNKGGGDFFRDNMALNYDEHHDIRFTTYPDYVVGEDESGVFTSKSALECTTRFAENLPSIKSELKSGKGNSNKENKREG